MQVQPTPIGPRSRASRLRLIALLAAVPAILVTVVATGLAGRAGEPDGPSAVATPTPAASAVVAGLPSPDARVSASPREPAATGLRPVLQGFAFPETALGIPVWDVRHAMAAHRQGEASGLVAVRGWLTIGPSPVSCIKPSAPPTVTEVSHARFFCRREAFLGGPGGRGAQEGDRESGQGSSSLASSGLQLPQWVLPGTPLPASIEPPFAHDERQLIPVVVVGRFDDERVVYCPAGGYGCQEGFVIESVVWMSGRWQESRSALEPGLESAQDSGALIERRTQAVSLLPGAGPLLAEALMAPEALPAVEPAAWSAAAIAEGPVWLMRAVVPSERGSFGRDVGWIVIEDRTGRVLASSRVATAPRG
jgi:hypothetical protein